VVVVKEYSVPSNTGAQPLPSHWPVPILIDDVHKSQTPKAQRKVEKHEDGNCEAKENHLA
jgi:hypothetical protein